MTSMRFITIALTLFCLGALSSCGGSSQGRFALLIALVGLEDSAVVGGHYEAWVISNGQVLTAGKFVVIGTGPTAEIRSVPRDDVMGTAAAAEFGPETTFLGQDFPIFSEGQFFFITLEPADDRDRIPSCSVVLAGAIDGNTATLSSTGVVVPEGTVCSIPDGKGMATLGFGSFDGAVGSFQLRSPTDDVTNPVDNDSSGVWFVSGAAPFAPGLDLPELQDDQVYEGWAVVDGVTRSLGRFRSGMGKDEDFAIAPQRGDDAPGPDFPGQDFVQDVVPMFANDPPVLTLVGSDFSKDGDFIARVTVEPFPDNDRAPFPLTVLEGLIPPNAVNASSVGRLAFDLAVPEAGFPEATAMVTANAITLTNLELQGLGSANGRRGHFALAIDEGGVRTVIQRFLIVGEELRRLDDDVLIGTRTTATFDAATTDLAPFPNLAGTEIVYITFECETASGPLPIACLLIGGDVTMGMAQLTTAGSQVATDLFLADLSMVTGRAEASTPTDDEVGLPANDQFGILFGITTSGLPLLELPVLGTGWRYEGWVEDRATGRVYSTGAFDFPVGFDDNDFVSLSGGVSPKPNVPGQDFLFDVPTEMLDAAVTGSISRVFVTIETRIDSEIGPSPFIVLDVPVSNAAPAATDLPLPNVFDDAARSATIDVLVVE